MFGSGDGSFDPVASFHGSHFKLSPLLQKSLSPLLAVLGTMQRGRKKDDLILDSLVHVSFRYSLVLNIFVPFQDPPPPSGVEVICEWP